MNFNKPLLWHQGLFLQPQHFQYNSLHMQQSIVQYMAQSSSYPWGVSSLQLDDAALNRGQFSIKGAEIIFEDGTFTNIPENAHIISRNFDSVWIDRTKPLEVYLGLAKLADDQSNVTVVTNYDSNPNITTRFVSLVEGEEFHDLHQGKVSSHLKTMKYAVTVLFNEEVSSSNNFVTIPIAVIEQHEDEAHFSSSFIPPSISMRGSSILMSTVKDIRDELVGRSKQLENYKSNPTSRAAEFNPVAERYRAALRVIARYAPMLNHHLENSVVHPLEIYGLIRSLVGELSTFSDKVNLLGETFETGVDLPKYQHKNLGNSFSLAKNIAITLLDELTVSPELLVKFTKDEAGRFSCQLPNDFFAKQHSMYIVLETATPFSEFITSFNRFAKLGSNSQVDIYVERAIPGIPFEHLSEQPTGLERRSKVTYFTISRNSEKWKLVEDEGKLSLQWDDAPEDLNVETVLVRG